MFVDYKLTFIKGMNLPSLQTTLQEINAYIELEKREKKEKKEKEKNFEFWKSMKVICLDEIEKAKSNKNKNGSDSTYINIPLPILDETHKLLSKQNLSQLSDMEKQLKNGLLCSSTASQKSNNERNNNRSKNSFGNSPEFSLASIDTDYFEGTLKLIKFDFIFIYIVFFCSNSVYKAKAILDNIHTLFLKKGFFFFFISLFYIKF
jgi:hypothetical protein